MLASACKIMLRNFGSDDLIQALAALADPAWSPPPAESPPPASDPTINKDRAEAGLELLHQLVLPRLLLGQLRKTLQLQTPTFRSYHRLYSRLP